MSEKLKGGKSGYSFVWGVVAGAVVGTISALLFAPKKGVELRQDIKEGASKAVEASNQALQVVSQKTVEVAKAVENKAVAIVGEAKQTFEKLTKREESTSILEETSEQAAEGEQEASQNEQAAGGEQEALQNEQAAEGEQEALQNLQAAEEQQETLQYEQANGVQKEAVHA